MNLRSWIGLSPINSWNIYEIVYSIVLMADLTIISIRLTPLNTLLFLPSYGIQIYFAPGFIMLLGLIILLSSIFYIGWWQSGYNPANTSRPDWAAMRYIWWLLSILGTLYALYSTPIIFL